MDAIQQSPQQKKISYAKWGYIFIASFFVVYMLFTLIPQVLTIWDSFFDYNEYFLMTDEPIQPCGFENYIQLFKKDALGDVEILRCLKNTIIMWLIGAIPQMLVALLLALMFTATKLKLKFTGFFKTVFYMPNIIMASAFAALFLILFSTTGPFHAFFYQQNWITENFDFISDKSARWLVAIMNFMMWFGNTMILLMAGIQGIDESVFESARIDGANSRQVLFDITLPLLKPIVVYVLINSMIGGLQMFDVPQVLTNKAKNNNTRTIVMLINDYLQNSNYGRAGAVSVILFIITGVLSIFVFKSINKKED